MINKKTDHDYNSCIQFVIGLQTVSGLMAGFAFTGAIVVLTGLGNPTALLAQIGLMILFIAIVVFLIALFELHLMNIDICVHSPLPIIPSCPRRWITVNRTMFIGSFLVISSIPVMFLLQNLKLLFVFSMLISALGYLHFYYYRWKPVRKKMEAEGIV
jgi:hypothetical protein